MEPFARFSNVRIFQDRKEAAQWLGVPVELLAAKNSSVD
jgi:uncharacterized protein (DUF2384 family)